MYDVKRKLYMKNVIEKLWDEYFSEECAVLNTEEEKELIERVVKAQKEANELLNREQREKVEKFVETLHEMHGISLKKAFCSGCEFATSFLLETSGLKR